jgi:hypothetical protein
MLLVVVEPQAILVMAQMQYLPSISLPRQEVVVGAVTGMKTHLHRAVQAVLDL